MKNNYAEAQPEEEGMALFNEIRDLIHELHDPEQSSSLLGRLRAEEISLQQRFMKLTMLRNRLKEDIASKQANQELKSVAISV